MYTRNVRQEYNAPNQREQLLIAGLHPHLLEKPVFWFQKRKKEILRARLTTPFWQHATVVAEAGLHIKLSEFLRSLHDLGYARVQTVMHPGEYAQNGGEVHVYPINERAPWHIDFVGNTIEAVEQTHLKETEVEISPLQKKLTPYVGFRTPRISRLGTPLWNSIKKKAKEDIVKFAKELLELYAKREIGERPPYAPYEDLEQSLAASFIHEETPDQAQAARDVLSDMETSRPLDRIILADVGFGKT